MFLWYIHPTPFGSLAIIWSQDKNGSKIVQLFLSKKKAQVKQKIAQCFPHATPSQDKKIKSFIRQIDVFFKGGNAHFSLDQTRLDLCSDFQKDVLCAIYRIPRGTLTTYKGIANDIGNPKGSRAVGNALANNPLPIIIPCHRAIRSDGALGNYQGGLAMKRALLKMEGAITKLSLKHLKG